MDINRTVRIDGYHQRKRIETTTAIEQDLKQLLLSRKDDDTWDEKTRRSLQDEIERRLEEAFVLVRMRVDMSQRKLYFAIDNLPWIDAGADTLPSSLRPCCILSDHEGASISLQDKVVFTEAFSRCGASPAPAPGSSYWNKVKGGVNS